MVTSYLKALKSKIFTLRDIPQDQVEYNLSGLVIIIMQKVLTYMAIAVTV
ncbi:hypothetical protein H4N54_03890 [Limnospira fusiformis KN01]|uniref:Uncharacterized protein n=1 Tax=Limnospira fusiformis PMC 851.14 TaxID=2219512 RepID=A0ABU9EKV3_LIMFS|nr:MULTISPECIES: hypothetical protein [Limnospira]MDC0839361.1 hypothetical protein [Limnoraphis robusta]MDT9187248.1 hypothetical protein [Limnospira sp. PMC 894.15]MDT9199377.1 hypothetical protein [Limnospira sp. PMC 1042.18]MDT9233223.1 hypothetical protein [Limnospira sp. PMC 917.15]MDT9276038.1 hypothetical protein [Limnospira sp. PMC 737.11]